jgi:hypothetical protein
MKRAKQYIFFIATLFYCNQLSAQKDTVQTLLKPVKLNIHYSYLQWELGYNGFLFSNTYIGGVGMDIFGIVFNNDADIAFGFDQGGTGGGYRMGLIKAVRLLSYSDFYIKAEPMLFPDKLINLAMPLKYGTATLSYSDTAAITYNRRRRTKSYSFTMFEPGLFAYVNVFRRLSIGAGLSYRIALSSLSSPPISDYDNFTFSAMLRFKIYTRNKRKLAAKKNQYYAPGDRFQ